MPSNSKLFANEARKIAFDEKHRKTIEFNISKYNAAVEKGVARYNNLIQARETAARIKRHTINNWGFYLKQFETNCIKRGIEVIWAKDDHEAITVVSKIIQECEAKLIVKSKSMTTEEIELNKHLEKIGCESVETDLGEFIVQVAGEKPYHIVTPAMHKSKEDIAILFNEKFGTPKDNTPEQLCVYVRNLLRQKFMSAQIGITGANFLIADIGAISLTENEGNGLMSVSNPKTHVVIAGIEKIIPKMEHLALFYPLLATHGTGQQITVYNSIISGPKRSEELNGPERMIVILIDNGRSTLYADPKARVALTCMRCGACLNACPVYRTIGGYTYNTTYSGPIGSVITPHMKGFKSFGHLSSASSLCGKCAEVCPVKIPISDLLLYNRSIYANEKLSPCIEQAAMKGYKWMAKNPYGLQLVPAWMKNCGTYPLNWFGWGAKRRMMKFKQVTFAQNHNSYLTENTIIL